MRKSCILVVAAIVGFVAGYFFLIRHFAPEIETVPLIVLSGFGGFALLALFGAFSTAFQRIKDNAVMKRAMEGKPFVDGKRAAALGRIEASGLSICTAPFSGKECVAYEYEVYEMITVKGARTTSRTKKLYCSGYGMAPPVVKTRHGDVRLLGFPLLDNWSKDEITDPMERNQADHYISQTSYQDPGRNIASVFSEFEDLFGDEDGAVRKDLGERVSVEDKHILTEIVVPAGAEVCALGVYSSAKNALVAGKNLAFPIRLIPGDVDAASSILKKSSSFYIVFALLFFLFVHALLGFLYYAYQKNQGGIPETGKQNIHQTWLR